MKRIRLLFLFVVSGAWIGAAELLPLEQHYPAKEFAPSVGDVKAALLLPNSAMVGESIAAQLVIENTGARPFAIMLGGDYRGTGYPLRMKVRVRNSEQVDLPRVDARPRFGGMMIPKRVEPGARELIEFPLDCYVEFPRAGTYLVTAGHDLGWIVDPAHPHPIAQASLTVTEPTSEQAAAYVNKLFADAEASPEHEGVLRIEKQLCVLRHPAYLPALAERARGGSAAAVKAIGHIATPEATATLLAMLDSQPPAITTTAVSQLLRRVPLRDDPSRTAEFNVWSSPYQIRPLLPDSWREEFSEPLVASAVKFLESVDTAEVESAAQILRALGEPEHAPALLAALQRALDVYQAPRSGAGANTLDAPKPQKPLIDALDALRARGWRIAYGGNMAHMVAWFRQLADAKVSTPVDEATWESMATWLENGPATVRIAALEALPDPLPDSCEPILLRVLNDADWGVLRVACDVAAKSKRPVFARPAVQILEEADDTFLQNAAHGAALSCGARLELWEAWVGAIMNIRRSSDALRALIEGTIELPRLGGGSATGLLSRDQRFALRAAWRDFLAAHREDLVAGRRVHLTDSATIARLTGMDFKPTGPVIELSLPDGSLWPPRPPQQ